MDAIMILVVGGVPLAAAIMSIQAGRHTRRAVADYQKTTDLLRQASSAYERAAQDYQRAARLRRQITNDNIRR